MSVTLAKVTDHNPAGDTDEPLFITVRTEPDGRVTAVELTDCPPWNDSVFRENGRSTVWQTPLPAYEGDPAHAMKVLDLAHSTTYRNENGTEWSKGEEEARAFYNNRTEERAFLRAAEARLILAGFLDGYTGIVRCQDYGLTLVGAEEHWAFRNHDGAWEFATRDFLAMEGWDHKGTIAPADASPARVAAAVLIQLADASDVDLAQLRPLARLRTRIGVWRLTPHWRNSKHRARLAYSQYRYRAREVYGRYRHRVTVRIDRDS
ncbi:hypothetical protein [Streptomyces sp. NPDC058758]|uniref:hypothetical protein n=1 Tax=Streptomyces sp. NPDC058758 TaxID=3346627 RepID=UPI00367E8FEF